MDVLADDFEQIVDRKIDFLASDAIGRAWADPVVYRGLLGLAELAVGSGWVLYSRWLVSKADLSRVEALTEARGAADFALRFCKTGEKAGEELFRLTSDLPLDFTAESNEVLFSRLRTFDALAHRQTAFLWATHPIARTVERKIRQAVELREKNPQKVEEFVALLCFPQRENTPVLENRALMQLASHVAALPEPKPKNVEILSPALRKAFEAHADAFGFLGVRGIGTARWAAEDFFSRASVLAQDPALGEKINKSRTEAARNARETNEALDRLDFSSEERALVAAAKEIVYFRTLRTEVMYHAFSQLDGLLSEIGRRFGYSLARVKQLSLGELLNLEQQNPPARLADARVFRFGLRIDSGSVRELTGDELALTEKNFSFDSDMANPLKGTPACRGSASGIVKILQSGRDVSKIQPGDVLVAAMTTPEMVPAMHLACAFVTDEGGITCHAAIVARELDKPCVIGTKTATRVLKDGELVRVDGTLGRIEKVNVSS